MLYSQYLFVVYCSHCSTLMGTLMDTDHVNDKAKQTQTTRVEYLCQHRKCESKMASTGSTLVVR